MNYIYMRNNYSEGQLYPLIACAENIKYKRHNVIYFAFSKPINTTNFNILLSMKYLELFSLDKINVIIGEYEWKQASFYCLKHIGLSSKMKLLMITNKNISDIKLSSPKPHSKLMTSLVYQKLIINNKNKQQVLIIQEQFCGLILAKYLSLDLLKQYIHDITYLIFILRKLDNALLLENGYLRILFVNQALSGE